MGFADLYCIETLSASSFLYIFTKSPWGMFREFFHFEVHRPCKWKNLSFNKKLPFIDSKKLNYYNFWRLLKILVTKGRMWYLFENELKQFFWVWNRPFKMFIVLERIKRWWIRMMIWWKSSLWCYWIYDVEDSTDVYHIMARA